MSDYFLNYFAKKIEFPGSRETTEATERNVGREDEKIGRYEKEVGREITGFGIGYE